MPQSFARENEFVPLAAISTTYQIVRSHVGTAPALLRRKLRHSAITLYEIRRLASRSPSRESLPLVQFSIALKEEIIAL
jgi:hypothetical protein